MKNKYMIKLIIIIIGLLIVVMGCSSRDVSTASRDVSTDDFSQIIKEQIQECEKLSDEISGSPISVNSEKDKCLTKLAIAEKNMKICYLIDDTIFRNDINKKESRIDYCFANYALQLNDAKGCDAMIGDYSSQCYDELNRKTNSNAPKAIIIQEK